MSHTLRPLEYCFVCDEPTDRAGQGDGSLYCECDKGPFCEKCWNNHHNSDAKVTDLLEALEGIRDLARTGTAPMAFNMTEREWNVHKLHKIAGEANRAIAQAKEPE